MFICSGIQKSETTLKNLKQKGNCSISCIFPVQNFAMFMISRSLNKFVSIISSTDVCV